MTADAASIPPPTRPKGRRRWRVAKRQFRHWADRAQFWPRFEVALAVLLLVASVGSYWALSQGSAPGAALVSDRRYTLLLSLNGVLLLTLMLMVGRRLAVLIANRRRGLAGSRLHVRMMQWFAAMAIVPTLLVAIFASLLFEFGFQVWFSDKVRAIIDTADEVASAYVVENRERIRGDVLAMAEDLRNSARLTDPEQLQLLVENQAALRNLDEAVVFKRSLDGRFLDYAARVNFRIGLSQQRLRLEDVERAQTGDLIILAGEGGEAADVVQALIRIDRFGEYFLYVNREVSGAVVKQVVSTQSAIAQYGELAEQRRRFQQQFITVLIVVSLLILFAAILVALYSADRLVMPIGRLVRAADRVGRGDLKARVPARGQADELDTLARAFNRMTAQLESQTTALLGANAELDERRQFTEAVLSGVSAGVLGLSGDGLITLPNRSACQLLGMDSAQMINQPLRDAVPEMAALFEAARDAADGRALGQVTLARSGATRTLLVQILAERVDLRAEGYVATFDDVTEQLADQRRAAWADVARRIAHEIKNPLTPIQLSAERLRRKYLKEIQTDPEVFLACTDTIIRQVGDLRRMVDEFSSFARMPKPVFKPEPLADILRQAIFLQELAHPAVRFRLVMEDGPVTLVCDRRQIAQAVTNVLKNAAEATAARQDGEASTGTVITSLSVSSDDRVVLSIADDGVGFPADLRERLTEPYVTTRAKGTGLGLAIVKKIVEDHAGDLVLSDNPEGGAVVTMTFSMAALAAKLAEQSVRGDGEAAVAPPVLVASGPR
jgi:two-component system nitrogen regulation sensor histidine kinase NtrY